MLMKVQVNLLWYIAAVKQNEKPLARNHGMTFMSVFDLYLILSGCMFKLTFCFLCNGKHYMHVIDLPMNDIKSTLQFDLTDLKDVIKCKTSFESCFSACWGED